MRVLSCYSGLYSLCDPYLLYAMAGCRRVLDLSSGVGLRRGEAGVAVGGLERGGGACMLSVDSHWLYLYTSTTHARRASKQKKNAWHVRRKTQTPLASLRFSDASSRK